MLSRREFFSKPPAPPPPRTCSQCERRTSVRVPTDGRSAARRFRSAKLIDQDFPGTMKMLADAGIQSIELCSPWYTEHNFGFGSLNKIDGRRVQSRAGGSQSPMHQLARGHDRVTPEKCRRPSAGRKTAGSRRSWCRASRPAQSDDGRCQASGGPIQRNRRRVHEGRAAAGLHTEGFELSMVDGKRVFDMLFDLLDPQAGEVPVPDVDDHERPGRRRLLHDAPRPVHLDASAGSRHERARSRRPRQAAAPAAAEAARRSRSGRAASTGSRRSAPQRPAACRTTSSR